MQRIGLVLAILFAVAATVIVVRISWDAAEHVPGVVDTTVEGATDAATKLPGFDEALELGQAAADRNFAGVLVAMLKLFFIGVMAAAGWGLGLLIEWAFAGVVRNSRSGRSPRQQTRRESSRSHV